MKKLLIPVLSAVILTSCGGEEDKKDEKKEFTVCDCVNGGKEMGEKMKAAGDDEEKMKAIKEEYKELEEHCKKLGEGKSEEEMKALMEEAKNC